MTHAFYYKRGSAAKFTWKEYDIVQEVINHL